MASKKGTPTDSRCIEKLGLQDTYALGFSGEFAVDGESA